MTAAEWVSLAVQGILVVALILVVRDLKATQQDLDDLPIRREKRGRDWFKRMNKAAEEAAEARRRVKALERTLGLEPREGGDDGDEKDRL